MIKFPLSKARDTWLWELKWLICRVDKICITYLKPQVKRYLNQKIVRFIDSAEPHPVHICLQDLRHIERFARRPRSAFFESSLPYNPRPTCAALVSWLRRFCSLRWRPGQTVKPLPRLGQQSDSWKTACLTHRASMTTPRCCPVYALLTEFPGRQLPHVLVKHVTKLVMRICVQWWRNKGWVGHLKSLVLE